MSIYKLTLAWIFSENSTTHEECWLILTHLPSLLWTSSHLTGLSAVRCRLPSPSSVANSFFELFFQLSEWRSLSVTSRSRVQTLCRVSHQNRQRDRLLGRPPTKCYITLTSPAVSRMFCSCNLDGFRDRWQVAVQLLFCRMLPPGVFQCCSQHSCAITVKLSVYTFSHVVRPYCSIDTTTVWKKLRFILFDFIWLPYDR